MKHVNIRQANSIYQFPGLALHSLSVVYLACALLLLGGLFAAPIMAANGPTLIYVVRHGKAIKQHPDKPLTAIGHAIATMLVDCFKDIKLTHVYSTHPNRSYDTVKRLSKDHGLGIRQIPGLGSEINGTTVTNRSPGGIATKPMVEALRNLPLGSTAVVGANSDNIYAILAGLGVRVGKDIPCADQSCFPIKEFDNVWLVMRGTGDKVAMARFRYDQPFKKLVVFATK